MCIGLGLNKEDRQINSWYRVAIEGWLMKAICVNIDISNICTYNDKQMVNIDISNICCFSGNKCIFMHINHFSLYKAKRMSKKLIFMSSLLFLKK